MRTGSRFALRGTTVVLTRPAGSGRTLARRLRALGALVIALPSARLGASPDHPDAVRAGLARAARAHVVVYSSPAAVRFAFQACPNWRPRAGAACLAPGGTTRAALARHGVVARSPDARLDSEGLLALPELGNVAGRTVALVGAPGGRELLATTLAARGARVQRVDVYRREPARWNARQRGALAGAPSGAYWLVSSVEAVRAVRAAAGPELWPRLARARAVAASARVAAALGAAGVRRVTVAGSALPRAFEAALLALARRARPIR
jgi:uroporphyrinogen-III synthase